jgi:hypothetical protein
MHVWLETERTRETTIVERIAERLIGASGQVINRGERINGPALVSGMRLLTLDILEQREY